MSMKKLFLKLSMLLFVLAMSVNAAWADGAQPVYLAAFKAQTSDASTGSGKVKLTWVDAQGKLFDNTAVAWLNYNTQQMPMPYGTGNPSNSDAFDATAMMIGATLTATESVEDSDPKSLVNQVLRNMMKSAKADSSHLFMTPYAYFKADAQGDNGSYFEEWIFNDARVWRQDTAMDKSAPESAYFKVLPNSANVMYMAPPSTVTNVNEAYGGATDNPNVINAVFKKYLLSNPVVVNNGTVTAEEGSRTTINLSVDVVGDMEQLKDDYADFDLPETTFAYDDEGEWTWALGTTPSEVLTSMKGRANLVITYTAKSGITVGTKRATFVAKMQGINPSTINIPLAVEVRPVSNKDASVTVGETTTEYTNLADAVADANSASGEVTLTLLRDVAVSSTVTLTNTMTLDLNSYTLSAASAADKGMADKAVITIDASGKTVTVAYNKLGGAIEAAPRVKLAVVNGVGVEVKAGTLVLNGGTISAQNLIPAYQWNETIAGAYWAAAPYEFASIQSIAIKVASGATLVQNGATITATSDGPNAYGIVNNGTVTINQGTISAEAQYNGAMAVNALSGSTTTVKGGSLSALVHEVSGTVTFNPAVPAGLSTWSNVYGLYVGVGSTVTIDGGELYAESTGASRAFGVGALANFGGTLTINKGATMRAKSPNTTESFPLCIMKAGELGGAVTINGGKFDGWFKSKKTGNDTINPAVFGLDYKDVTFKSGMCKTGLFFMVHPSFSSSANHPANTLCNVVKGGKDYNDGYRYIAVADPATQADLIAAGVPAARIGTTGYTKLEDAIAYANNNPSEELVIFMQNNYTLPAGYYTLPAKATLVIPMSDDQAKEINDFPQRIVFNDLNRQGAYEQPTEFRRLTFAPGVNIDVFGAIEMTCTQLASNEAYTSQPTGPYGHLVMEEGSHMTLMANSELRAWGFMTGKGETDARRDARVREMFQMGDWKGAFTSVKITGMIPDDFPLQIGDDSDKKIFPVTQYFIQNIESPVKYHPGSVLSTSAAVSEGINMGGGISVSMMAPDIKVVGLANRTSGVNDDAIFLLDNGADADNTWVRKWYDSEHDIQVYDINSKASIGSMEIDLGDLSLMGYTIPVRLNSAHFDLPLTSNFKIHLLSGTMDFLQNTSLLPGAEVEVDKESTVTVAMDDDEKDEYDAWVDGGKEGDAPVSYTGALYVYDADQWGKYAYCNVWDGEIMQNGTAYTKTVRYAPSWEGRGTTPGKPDVRDEQTKPADAAINIHGTFATATGFVYCSESGAKIFSNNEDAGTFIFNESAEDAGERTVYNVKGSSTYEDLTFYPAKLKNGAGAEQDFANTEDAEEGDAYCYTDNKWNIFEVAEDDCFMKDDYGTYYAKPQEYVALANGMTSNTDHTYSDAAGAGRLFILTEDCQWWEVEKKDNLYHCIHPDNDTYYEYGSYTYHGMAKTGWHKKLCTITWKNWNGDAIQTADHEGLLRDSYEVTYGTMAEFLGTNPTRESNIDYTYDFTGWSPTPGKVTSDVTYTATFTEKPRKYTIIFCQEGGVEIERQFLTHNEVPVCENTPTKAGHTLVWSPAVAAVTGDATYTATWEENPPTEYEITFYDYNGTSVLKQGNVNVGDMPVPPAQVNGKPATSEFTYVFDHWSPAVEKVSATSIKSYTAVYRQVAKTFPVNFYFGSISAENKIGATQFLEIGQDPVIPNDERLQLTEDDANVYQLVWTPQIQTVIGHAEDYTYNYVASYTSTPKQYSLTLKCTPSGAAVVTGARADYVYGATPTVTVKANTGYNFVSWSDGESIGDPDEDGVYSREVTINGNIELTVVCECPDCDKSTIIWKNEAGDAELATDLVPVGSATIYHAATPTKENSLDGQYSYTFYGWTTAANEGGTKYKNGMTPKVAAAEQTYIYYACFTPVVRQYNVALSSNIENVCVLVGAGTYDYSASNNATAIVSGYDAVNYTFDGWYKEGVRVSTAESYSFAVQSDVDLVAKFSPVTYTITWKSEDGVSTLETDANQAYGATTAFNGTEPTKTDHSFIGWTTAANGEGSFYAKGATPAVSGNATYYAYFAENTRSLEIGANGSETLAAPTDYTAFTITSNGVDASGQLFNANNLSLLGEAIFKLQPASAIPARTWYAVAAPWQVDVRTGIYADGRKLNVGIDFDIIEFNAESYAVNEAGEGNKNIWRYVEENSGVMMPGKLYLIYLASAQSSLEFHKTGGGISTTTLSLTTTSGSGDKANWNAVANPALYHADLVLASLIDDTDEKPDVLQYINGGYTPTTASNMIVGQPIFVQVTTPQPSVSADVASGVAPAPYRALQAQNEDNRFVVEIARNGQMNDRLIVQTSDEKENTYVIGKDLAKMGVGTKTAQIWMERYNTKLCKNTVEMANDRAEYPLSIYAPAAGEYVLTAMQHRGNEVLYLTRDGEAIWNLSEGDYVLTLEKGTATQYGLRVSARAPQVTTGVDEAIVNAQGDTRKVLINNQVFIIRGNNVYSIDGQLIR